MIWISVDPSTGTPPPTGTSGAPTRTSRGSGRTGRKICVASPPDTVAEDPLVASVVPLVPAWRVDRTFDYLVDDSLAQRVAIGSLVRVPLGHRKVRGVVLELGRRPATRPLEPVAGLVLEAPLLTRRQIETWEWLSLRYCAPRGLAYSRAVPGRVRISVPAPVKPHGGGSDGRLGLYSRGPELLAAIAESRPGTWCLRTVPGESRDEIVAQLVSVAAGAGSASLVAVPEMRHGSSVLEELVRRWPESARLDSTRPEPERAKAWLRMSAGHFLGAGGRTAVLAPAPSVGLIVVDEEHHRALKEDQSPRFDARKVAHERARHQDAVCVLISPTPSVETGAAMASGDVLAAEPARADERAARPIVELVEPPGERVLSAELHRAVSGALAAGRRAALLVPRRGFARTIWCARCRRSLRCPVCEASLAYDRAPRSGSPRVRCPRCAFEGTPPGACPVCGAVEWRLLGAGSERLAEQVRKAWPRARVARADPDGEVDAHRDGPAPDIYVTTWVGTKPSVRPDVSLVGVLDADSLIRRPDFRAAEGAYQALVAMAEWAGPASRGGRLVVQCSEPGHHVVQAVARADYGHFLRRELEQRAELGYPPYSELIELQATGERAADIMSGAVRACREEGARVLGPVPAAGRDARLTALVKCAEAQPVAAKLRGILAAAPPGTRLRVDVDPR